MRRQLKNGLLFLSVLLAVFSLTGCKPESLVSQSQEIDIGRQASRDIERQYKVSADSRLNAMVNEIGQNLAARSDRPNLKYTFKVLDVKDVNAVSLPGGWIYVYKGLIDEIGGPGNIDRDKLAGVISHEIGHVAARHHAQMMGRSQLYGIGIGVLTKGNTAQWVSLFANINLLHWSRKDEYEADKLGIKYTYGSTYDPNGLIEFLQVLQSKSKSEPSRFESWFRTHPVPSDRVGRAQQYLNELRTGSR
ncbi:MAG: M48 family metallopeptidase [Armatimonadota bacterium]|nr:M48 family metallopeptidase [Armatimonadota bacterium]